jgi:hypothetical protein
MSIIETINDILLNGNEELLDEWIIKNDKKQIFLDLKEINKEKDFAKLDDKIIILVINNHKEIDYIKHESRYEIIVKLQNLCNIFFAKYYNGELEEYEKLSWQYKVCYFESLDGTAYNNSDLEILNKIKKKKRMFEKLNSYLEMII